MQAPNANISQDLGDGANGVQLSSFEKEMCALKKSSAQVGLMICIIASKLQTGKAEGPRNLPIV